MPQDTSLDPLVDLARKRAFEASRLRCAMVHAFAGCCSHLNSFTASLGQLTAEDMRGFQAMANVLKGDARLMIVTLEKLTGVVEQSGTAAADTSVQTGAPVAPALTVVPTGDDPTFRVAVDGDWPTMG